MDTGVGPARVSSTSRIVSSTRLRAVTSPNSRSRSMAPGGVAGVERDEVHLVPVRPAHERLAPGDHADQSARADQRDRPGAADPCRQRRVEENGCQAALLSMSSSITIWPLAAATPIGPPPAPTGTVAHASRTSGGKPVAATQRRLRSSSRWMHKLLGARARRRAPRRSAAGSSSAWPRPAGRRGSAAGSAGGGRWRRGRGRT